MNRRAFVVGTVACFAGAGGFATPAVAVADRVLTELHVDDLRDTWLRDNPNPDKPNLFSQWLTAHLTNRVRLVYGKYHRVYGVKPGIGAWRLGGSAYFVANEAVDRYDGVDHVWKSRSPPWPQRAHQREDCLMDGIEKLNVRKLLELVNAELGDAVDNQLFEPNEPVDETAFVQRQIDELERLKREELIVSYTVPERPLEQEWTIVLAPPTTITAKIVANDAYDGSL